jgi:hypothetical protein
MCCSPEKRALKAQRKLDRAQRRMDVKAAKYAPSCQPFTTNYRTNTNYNNSANNTNANSFPSTFDPVSAMASLRIQGQSQQQTRALQPMESDRVISTNPPSYGAVMGSEYESSPFQSEKSGHVMGGAMDYGSTEHACSAGSSSQGIGARAMVAGSGHMRRGGCGGMLVRLVKGAYEANKERKAARQVAETREY